VNKGIRVCGGQARYSFSLGEPVTISGHALM
jgi:hypothetical protein